MSIWGTWRSPWAGTDPTATLVIFTDGVFGAANTYALFNNFANDEPTWQVRDNAGNPRNINSNVLNWPADTDNQVVVRTGGNDNIGLYWNSVWNNTAAGAGTGVRNAAQTTTYISGDSTAGSDVWTRNLQFFRRMLEVIP
jgi:hypothetical protein